jgi:transposase
MSNARTRKRPRSRRLDTVQKPHGTFHPRVQLVGPEHFGIISVDCAKARSKFMVADFFGNVLIPPTIVAHNRRAFDDAIRVIRQTLADHDIRDRLVAVERTGRYHHPVRRAFAAAGFETRIVHPFATSKLRQSSDPGNKTDDTDLSAIHRAAVNGFALLEHALDEDWTTLQILIRHRRDLVRKTATLQTQIREHLDATLPGFAACFEDLWKRDCALYLFRHFASAADILAAGADGLCRGLDDAGIRYQRRTLDPVLEWAARAAVPDLGAGARRRCALALDDDRLQKTLQIQALERDIAAALTRTPYILLLSFPGVNVVSAADFAGEAGPMDHYANHRAITGRAGLRPSRYQSDQVDKANGPLVRCCNRTLRAAILRVADNLIKCNHHFNILAHTWTEQGKDARHTRVKVASRFCRIAYHIVAGRQVFHHPSMQQRHYILHKLTQFHADHGSGTAELLRDLQATVAHLPRQEYQAEAAPLHEELEKIQRSRRQGPQLLGDILPIVLARLGVGAVQSETSGEQDPHQL